MRVNDVVVAWNERFASPRLIIINSNSEVKKTLRSDPSGKRGEPLEGPIKLPPFGILTLRVEPE